MKRLSKLKTPKLALVLCLPAELLFVGFGVLARWSSPSDDNLNVGFRCFSWFHRPPLLAGDFLAGLLPLPAHKSLGTEIVGMLILSFFVLLQWYLILLVSIGLFRLFRQKPV
jgi:hypothetical protein